MKIAVIGDVHWSKHSSILRSRGKKYSKRLEALIDSLNWCEETADKCGTDMVVYLGDFFDTPNLNAEEVTALKEIGWNYQKHFFLVGNHELGLSANDFNVAEVFSLIDNADVISQKCSFEVAGKTIEMVPYYLEENRPELDTADIIFSHNDLKMQYGQYLSTIGYDLNDIAAKCKLFINGHLHNHYITGNVINLGNICGQNFNEDGFKYEHYMMIVDTDTMTYQLYENPYAIKFFKIENEKVFLRNSAVASIKCPYDELEAYKDYYKDILECRFIVERTKSTSNGDKPDIDISVIDHLSRFREYVLANIGNDDMTVEELNEVCK